MDDLYLNDFDKDCKKVKKDCYVNKQRTANKTSFESFYKCCCDQEETIYICSACYEDCHQKFCIQIKKEAENLVNEENNNEKDKNLKNSIEAFENYLKTTCKEDNKAFNYTCQCQTKNFHDLQEKQKKLYDQYSKTHNEDDKELSKISKYSKEISEYVKYEFLDYDEKGEYYSENENENKKAKDELFENHKISYAAAIILNKIVKEEESFTNKKNSLDLLVLLVKCLKKNAYLFLNDNIDNFLCGSLENHNNQNNLSSGFLYVYRKLKLIPSLMKMNKNFISFFGYDENLTFLQRKIFLQNEKSEQYDLVKRIEEVIKICKTFLLSHFNPSKKTENKNTKINDKDKNIIFYVKEFSKYVELLMNYEVVSNKDTKNCLTIANLEGLLTEVREIKNYCNEKEYYRLDKIIFLLKVKITDYYMEENVNHDKKKRLYELHNIGKGDLRNREFLARDLGKNNNFLELGVYEKAFYQIKYFEEFYTQPLKHFIMPDYVTEDKFATTLSLDDDVMKIEKLINEIIDISKYIDEESSLNFQLEFLRTSIFPKRIINKLCEHSKTIEENLKNLSPEERKNEQNRFMYRGYTCHVLSLYQFITSNRFFVKIFEECSDYKHLDDGDIYNSFNFFISVNLKLLFILIGDNELLIPLFFNSKFLKLIFANKKISEDHISEKINRIKEKEKKIRQAEDKLINSKDKDEDDKNISEENKIKSKKLIDLDKFKSKLNVEKDVNLHTKNVDKTSKNNTRDETITANKECIRKLSRKKPPIPEIFKALDFNNILSFYIELIKQLINKNKKIDLTFLIKNLETLSIINTEIPKIYGAREQINQNFIKINDMNIFCNILVQNDQKENNAQIFKFSLKLNSSILKILSLSYRVNSTLYKDICQNNILCISCKIVDDLNYYIFRSVRDNDIVLERTSEKVKELFSKLKDIYKDLPIQYKRIFKIADHFSSFHFLLIQKLINGDYLTEQINSYKKKSKQKSSEMVDTSNKQFEDTCKQNEIERFIQSMIDFQRELEPKYAKSFIKYYFKDNYFIRDCKALEESIQTTTIDIELDYMMIKKQEEEERQKMIYYDGEYIPKKTKDKKIDYYLLREIRNFLSLNFNNNDLKLSFDLIKKKNSINPKIESKNPLKLVISYYRDAIAYPMFQVIYNMILTKIVEDNLKNIFSILFGFMETTYKFLNLIKSILEKVSNPDDIECREILDNLFNLKNLKSFIENDMSSNDLKLLLDRKLMLKYLKERKMKVDNLNKSDMYTKLYTYLKNRNGELKFNNEKVDNLLKPNESRNLYLNLINDLANIIKNEEKNFDINQISKNVTIMESLEKEKQKNLYMKNYNNNANNNYNSSIPANQTNPNEENMYRLDDIFNKLFKFVYLFNFGFNNYDMNNDEDDEEDEEEEEENEKRDIPLDKEINYEIFSLKNTFKTKKELEICDDEEDDEKNIRLDKFFKNFENTDEKEDDDETPKNVEDEINEENNEQTGPQVKKLQQLLNDNDFRQSLFSFKINQDLEESEKPSFYNNIDLIIHSCKDQPNFLQASIIKFLPQEKHLNFFTFNYNNEIANISYLIYLDLINFDRREIDDKFKDYFLSIVEFYRLLCEDHNANFQSILTDPTQNEVMDEYNKRLKEEKKEEKKRNRLKNKYLSTKNSNDKKNQESDDEESDDDSDEEENYEIDSDGHKIIQNHAYMKYKYINERNTNFHNVDSEIKVKNPHKVGNNIVEVLVNLWININETMCYYKEKENFIKYIRVLNYEKIEKIINLISEFLIEIIQGSYQENLENITFEEGQPLNLLLKTIFKIINYITREIPNSIEEDEKIKSKELNKLRSIMEFTLKKFIKFVISYIEENENPDSKKSSVLRDIKPATYYSLIRYCIVKIYLRYGDDDHKNQLEKYVQSDMLERLYKIDNSVRKDDLFELGSLVYQFMKISANLSIRESQKFKRFLSRLREEKENFFEKTKKGFFSDKIIMENENSLDKSKISVENMNIQIYIFMERIIQYIEISYIPSRHHELLEGLNQYPNKKFLSKVNQTRIENNKDKSLQRVFFIANYLTMFMDKQDTLKFIDEAPFLNFNQRLDYIFRKVNNFLDLINTRYYLFRKMTLIYKLQTFDLVYITIFSVIIALITNIILLLSMNVDNINSYKLKTMVDFMGLFHIYILFLCILVWLAVKILIIKLKYSCIGNKYKKFKKLDSVHLMWKQTKNILHLFKDSDISLISLNLIFGILAFSNKAFSFFYALQLIPIFFLVMTMKNVLIAIWEKIEQFISSALLIFILILFFSSVSFLFFRELYFSPDLNENVCDSFSHCFLTILNYGIRSGSIGDFGNVKSFSDPLYWSHFIFSWVFYFIVILIMLNIINGIIIDTFQDLREKTEEKDDCKENMCYVCSNRRSRFEMCGLNFEEHISDEHSIREYLYYLIKNYLVNEHDLNAVDSYVLELTKNKRLDFFPIKTSINLEKLSNHK